MRIGGFSINKDNFNVDALNHLDNISISTKKTVEILSDGKSKSIFGDPSSKELKSFLKAVSNTKSKSDKKASVSEKLTALDNMQESGKRFDRLIKVNENIYGELKGIKSLLENKEFGAQAVDDTSFLEDLAPVLAVLAGGALLSNLGSLSKLFVEDIPAALDAIPKTLGTITENLFNIAKIAANPIGSVVKFGAGTIKAGTTGASAALSGAAKYFSKGTSAAAGTVDDAAKAAKAAVTVASKADDAAKVASSASKASSAAGLADDALKVAGAGSKFLKGVPIIGTALGYGVETALGGDKTEAGVGAAGSLIGGGLGSFLGPIGTIAGSVAGDWIARKGYSLYNDTFGDKTSPTPEQTKANLATPGQVNVAQPKAPESPVPSSVSSTPTPQESSILDTASSVASSLWNSVTTAFSDSTDTAVSAGSSAIESVNSSISTAASSVESSFTKVFPYIEGIYNSLTNQEDTMKEMVDISRESIPSQADEMDLKSISMSVGNAIGSLSDKVKPMVDQATAGLGDMWDKLAPEASKLWDQLSKDAGPMMDQFTEAGGKVMQGMLDMISDSAKRVSAGAPGSLVARARAGDASGYTENMMNLLRTGSTSSFSRPNVMRQYSAGGAASGFGYSPQYMPGGPSSLSNQPQKVTTNTPVSTKQGDMMKQVYASFRNAGFSDAQSKALSAEVGRENDFNAGTIFGSHKDAANSASNLGFFSWQGDRRKALEKYLGDRGLMKDGKMVQGQESLNAMAAFAKDEMQSGKFKGMDKFLNNPDIGKDEAAWSLGKNYIKWAIGQDTLKNGTLFDWRKHYNKSSNYYDQMGSFGDQYGSEGPMVAGDTTGALAGLSQRATSNVDVKNLNADYATKLSSFSADIEKEFGRKVKIDSGYRAPTAAEKSALGSTGTTQADILAQNGKTGKVASLYGSKHGTGQATDIRFADMKSTDDMNNMSKADKEKFLAIAQKHGLDLPLRNRGSDSEWWHVEPAGLERGGSKLKGQAYVDDIKSKSLQSAADSQKQQSVAAATPQPSSSLSQSTSTANATTPIEMPIPPPVTTESLDTQLSGVYDAIGADVKNVSQAQGFSLGITGEGGLVVNVPDITKNTNKSRRDREYFGSLHEAGHGIDYRATQERARQHLISKGYDPNSKNFESMKERIASGFFANRSKLDKELTATEHAMALSNAEDKEGVSKVGATALRTYALNQWAEGNLTSDKASDRDIQAIDFADDGVVNQSFDRKKLSALAQPSSLSPDAKISQEGAKLLGFKDIQNQYTDQMDRAKQYAKLGTPIQVASNTPTGSSASSETSNSGGWPGATAVDTRFPSSTSSKPAIPDSRLYAQAKFGAQNMPDLPVKQQATSAPTDARSAGFFGDGSTVADKAKTSIPPPAPAVSNVPPPPAPKVGSLSASKSDSEPAKQSSSEALAKAKTTQLDYLKKQLDEGKISQEEYDKKVAETDKTFGQATSVAKESEGVSDADLQAAIDEESANNAPKSEPPKSQAVPASTFASTPPVQQAVYQPPTPAPVYSNLLTSGSQIPTYGYGYKNGVAVPPQAYGYGTQGGFSPTGYIGGIAGKMFNSFAGNASGMLNNSLATMASRAMGGLRVGTGNPLIDGTINTGVNSIAGDLSSLSGGISQGLFGGLQSLAGSLSGSPRSSSASPSSSWNYAVGDDGSVGATTYGYGSDISSGYNQNISPTDTLDAETGSTFGYAGDVIGKMGGALFNNASGMAKNYASGIAASTMGSLRVGTGNPLIDGTINTGVNSVAGDLSSGIGNAVNSIFGGLTGGAANLLSTGSWSGSGASGNYPSPSSMSPVTAQRYQDWQSGVEPSWTSSLSPEEKASMNAATTAALDSGKPTSWSSGSLSGQLNPDEQSAMNSAMQAALDGPAGQPVSWSASSNAVSPISSMKSSYDDLMSYETAPYATSTPRNASVPKSSYDEMMSYDGNMIAGVSAKSASVDKFPVDNLAIPSGEETMKYMADTLHGVMTPQRGNPAPAVMDGGGQGRLSSPMEMDDMGIVLLNNGGYV